jgi:Zn-dependent peptidase ImmA (M78 family)
LEDLYSLSLDGLQSLKLKWKVSIALMIERLRDLGMLNQDQYRRLRINYSARQWSKKEPYDDEIAVEEPGFMTRALRLMLEGHTHTVDQLSASTGFSRDWIEWLLNVPPDLETPKPQLKLVDFKRRA